MSLWDQLLAWCRELFTGSRFLCDRCRYNYGSACLRPERPNAIRCPDFRAR